tara:strand:- start:304 stop:858 length:555 start_codon:yes stop_codon:yes gene_type:complete
MTDKKIVEILYSRVSPENRKIIQNNINLIFTAPVHNHYCSTIQDGVKLCHIDPVTCWSREKVFGTKNACQQFCDQPLIKNFMAESKFAYLSQEYNFSSCLMQVGGENRSILYRLFDDKFGMLQWNASVPTLEMWEQLLPTSQAIGLFYEFPMVLVSEGGATKPSRAMKTRRRSTWENTQFKIVK